MGLYRLVVEGRAALYPASLEAVQLAVRQLAVPEGPTFLTLVEEGGSWAQAGGTDGRYRVEARYVYGEGYKHFMAARADCQNRSQTVVHYRNVCTEGEHPHRKCPLPATVANVLSLDDVMVVLTEYWVTGELSARFDWDDVTEDWTSKDPDHAGIRLKEIKPKKGKGTGA